MFGVAFSPDGGTLASASYDNTVILWDAKTRARLGAPLAGHTGTVWGVAFSPDGGTLASASCDNTVILWDAKTRCARRLAAQRPSPGTRSSRVRAWRSAPTAARSPPPPATRPSSSGTPRRASGSGSPSPGTRAP